LLEEGRLRLIRRMGVEGEEDGVSVAKGQREREW